MKKLLTATFALAAFLALPTSAAAATPETTDAFVCPVLGETAGENIPHAIEIGEGDYSFLPGGPESGSQELNIPIHATNGDGEGTAPGTHSGPGDSDYTAIWAGQ